MSSHLFVQQPHTTRSCSLQWILQLDNKGSLSTNDCPRNENNTQRSHTILLQWPSSYAFLGGTLWQTGIHNKEEKTQFWWEVICRFVNEYTNFFNQDFPEYLCGLCLTLSLVPLWVCQKQHWIGLCKKEPKRKGNLDIPICFPHLQNV